MTIRTYIIIIIMGTIIMGLYITRALNYPVMTPNSSVCALYGQNDNIRQCNYAK